MSSIHRAAVAAALALGALAAPRLHAQGPTQVRTERCTVIPDTAAAPSARQIEERNELRTRIESTLRSHGAPPAGLLMVDVTPGERGKLLFMETQLADSTRAAALAHVAEYLQTLDRTRPYQALIRIDGEYPAMTPGRRHCRPELANPDSMSAMMQRVLERHPEAGRHNDEPLVKRAVVRMVVTREGHVAFAEVDTTSGDELIDANVEHIASRLRFRPATLDAMPFDVRFRFTMTFRIY
jgi:TonB family protein